MSGVTRRWPHPAAGCGRRRLHGRRTPGPCDPRRDRGSPIDDIDLWLALDARSPVLDCEGRPARTLFTFGSLTRGRFGEMPGAPVIAHAIEELAGRRAAITEGQPA